MVPQLDYKRQQNYVMNYPITNVAKGITGAACVVSVGGSLTAATVLRRERIELVVQAQSYYGTFPKEILYQKTKRTYMNMYVTFTCKEEITSK